MQGSLIESLRWCRPTYFFAVPRVWEKLEILTKEFIMSQNDIVKKLFSWGQDVGLDKVINYPKKCISPNNEKEYLAAK